MDCQPQNLIHFSKWRIASVLDWEEACYADPRFELLLLSRKVCASREQADVLWRTYEQEMNKNIGPIEAWLKLEAVHSLTTSLLQSMDLGGRSPWETKPDLLGKMEREFHRLFGLGYKFCKDVIKS
jgi:thiamine kinase-like enzyme